VANDVKSKKKLKKSDSKIEDEDSSKLEEKSKSDEKSELETKLDLKNKELNDANEKLAIKDEELADSFSNLQRLQADFENFKKQNEKHTQDFIQFANEQLIKELLDSYEDFRRVLDNYKNLKELEEGTELIYSKIKKFLEKEGLKEISIKKGDKFDFNKHEALMTEDNEKCENNQIIEELMKGYTLKDKVIKYSKVKVCKKKNKTSQN
jgi:molecular chaperone GrpE